MIYTLLGIIIGILLSIISIIGTYLLSQKANLKTRLSQVDSVFKKKGEVFEAGNDEVEDWVDNLKKE